MGDRSGDVSDSLPLVSVIMANFNGAAHIAEAVRSVLDQTLRSLELIVSDDGSTDESLALARRAGADDPRLVILESAVRSGPAGARNRALEIARGRWIAIVDNDDYIASGRLARLTTAAEADGADIAADNLTVFYDADIRPAHPHLRAAAWRAPRWISAAEYARSNILLSGGAQLGYLKPIFRNANAALRYDEGLTIGEDADLVLRALIAGARMRVYPECGYFYRKRAGSLSHRLSEPSIAAMLAALDRLGVGEHAALAAALSRQRSALLDAGAFTVLVAALKAGDLIGALRAAASRPGGLLLLRDPIGARFMRLLRPQRRP